MAQIASSTEIPATPEQVWEKLANPYKLNEWLDTHDGLVGDAPENLTTGDGYKEKVKIMGMPGEVDWTVIEADEARRMAAEGKGPMGVTLKATYDLEPVDGGTLVSYEAEFGGAALMPMQKALEKSAKESAEKSFENLKQLLG